MSEAKRAERPRLLDLLRRADNGEQIDIPDNVPVDEAAEAAADGNTEFIQEWIGVFQHFTQRFGDGVNVQRLKDEGLRAPAQLQSVHPSRWPLRLSQWSRLVQAAKDRREAERQAIEKRRSAAEAEERQARNRADIDQSKLRAEREQAEQLDAFLRLQSEMERIGLANERNRDQRLADVVAERMTAPLTPDFCRFAWGTDVDPDAVRVTAPSIPTQATTTTTTETTKGAIQRLDALGFAASRGGTVKALFDKSARYPELFDGAREQGTELWCWEVLLGNFERKGKPGKAGMSPRLVPLDGGRRVLRN